MPKLPADQVIQRIRDGNGFRIEREDAHLICMTTGKVRDECGVRELAQQSKFFIRRADRAVEEVHFNLERP